MFTNERIFHCALIIAGVHAIFAIGELVWLLYAPPPVIKSGPQTQKSTQSSHCGATTMSSANPIDDATLSFDLVSLVEAAFTIITATPSRTATIFHEMNERRLNSPREEATKRARTMDRQGQNREIGSLRPLRFNQLRFRVRQRRLCLMVDVQVERKL